ncbi:hypothetical protein HU200_034660 [Digitaria exilis]|uniref:Uncharacterized protein n=1 Tax=Digitaria exilis TaxID=1010633 RepID=A0A835BKB6_9POAL|nr:hypothetical protein HU200_034660 [Digitaria exilis]
MAAGRMAFSAGFCGRIASRSPRSLSSSTRARWSAGIPPACLPPMDDQTQSHHAGTSAKPSRAPPRADRACLALSPSHAGTLPVGGHSASSPSPSLHSLAVQPLQLSHPLCFHYHSRGRRRLTLGRRSNAMAVDPRQVVAGFLTLSMFVMLGNMIKHDHFSSSTRGVAERKTMTFNYVVSLTDKTSVEKFLDHYRESAPGIADAYAAVLLLVRAKFLL